MTLSYSHENGYGNEDLKEIREMLYKGIGTSWDRMVISSLIHDYETLLSVIEGKAVFKHPDGSETRRIKLYDTR